MHRDKLKREIFEELHTSVISPMYKSITLCIGASQARVHTDTHSSSYFGTDVSVIDAIFLVIYTSLYQIRLYHADHGVCLFDIFYNENKLVLFLLCYNPVSYLYYLLYKTRNTISDFLY